MEESTRHDQEVLRHLEDRFTKMAQFIATTTKRNDQILGEIQAQIKELSGNNHITPYSNQSATIGKIAIALSKAQKEIGLATATGTTGRSNATALTMTDILEACSHVLEKHELSVAFDWAYNELEHEILIIKLLHSSGEWLANGTLLLAEKTMPNEAEYQKKRSAAITYVMKNLLRTKLCIGKE